MQVDGKKETVDQYLSFARLSKSYDVCSTTMRRWAEKGLVRYVRLDGGKRLFAQCDVHHLFTKGQSETDQKENLATTDTQRRRIIYARVSSQHQEKDLERQAQSLKEAYPEHELITEIGSGLNFHRKKFSLLLEHIREGRVQEVVVAHNDRLCRFAFELVEWICKKGNCKIVVHDKCDGISDERGGATAQQELSEDIIAVTTFFVARHNGMRAAENRRKRKEMSEAEH
jgi:putative resolvase